MKKLLYSLLIVFILPCMFLFTGCGEKKNNNVYYTLPTLEHVTVTLEAVGSASDDKGEYLSKNQEFKIVVTPDQGYEFESAPIAHINGTPITLNDEGYRYASNTLYAKDFSKIDVTVTAQVVVMQRTVLINYDDSYLEDTSYIINNYTLTFNETFANILGVAANRAIRMNGVEVGIKNPRTDTLKYGDELKFTISANGENVFEHAWSNPFYLQGADNIWQSNITDNGIEYTLNIYAFSDEQVTLNIDENSFSNSKNVNFIISVEDSSYSSISTSNCGLFTATVNDMENLPLTIAQKSNNYIKIAYTNYETYKDYYDNAIYEINYTTVTATMDNGVVTIDLLPLKEYGDPFTLSLNIKNLVDRMVEDGKLQSLEYDEFVYGDTKYSVIEFYRITPVTTAISNYYFVGDVVLDVTITLTDYTNLDTIFHDDARCITITATTTTGETKESVVWVNIPDVENGVTLVEDDSALRYKLTLSQEFLTDVSALSFTFSYT